ncbi:hypothetical protein SAMN05446934_9605 [Paraburkholderia hospita]|nr:hypothetical protein SAMN05446934_9605 [Paraburkholderia hospita]
MEPPQNPGRFTYRLEILAHFIVANCEGNTPVSPKNVLNWLNRQLGKHPIATMEDPPEDMFVVNVVSASGDFLVLGGLWEVPDGSLNMMIELLESASVQADEMLRPVYALLKLSDFVLRRAGLARWTIEPSAPNGPFPDSIAFNWGSTNARAVVSLSDLEEADVGLSELRPFIFSPVGELSALANNFAESSLQQAPVIEFNDCVVLALPSAVTYAARRYLLKELSSHGQLRLFQEAVNRLVFKRACDSLRIGGRHQVEQLPLPEHVATCGELGRSAVFRLGQQRYFHLLVLSDELEHDVDIGFLEPREYGTFEQAQIESHVAGVRMGVESSGPFAFGHTLALFGHLGRAVLFETAVPPANWTFDLCRLQELEFVTWDKKGALNRVTLMLTQRAQLAAQGYEFRNLSGLLNLYAYWLDQDCYILPADLPRSGAAHLQLGTNHLTGFRARHRRSVDRHCEPNTFGGYDTVFRENRDAVYSIVREQPVFLSMTRLQTGGRSFCFDVSDTTIWVSATGTAGEDRLGYAKHRAWDELKLLLPIALLKIAPQLRYAVPAVELLLDFRHVLSVEEATECPLEDEDYDLLLHTKVPLVKVTPGPAFLRTFSGTSNDGERKFLAAVLSGLDPFQLPSDTPGAISLSSEERAVLTLGGTDAKLFHAFENLDPVEYLLAKLANPVFERPDEHVGAAQRTAFEFYPILRKRQTLSRDDSCKALNAAVTHLMVKVTEKLRQFNKRQLISHLLFLHETQLSDKHRWRSTARAVQALYGAEDGLMAASEADAERTEVSVTLRTLVEAAVCECTTTGGAEPDDFSVDELYGLMCTLISLGRHSETIYHGLSSRGIIIAPSGAYAFSPDLLEAIGVPYKKRTFAAGYADAAGSYEELVVPSQSPKDASQGPYDDPLYQKAFKVEYGFDFAAFVEISATLIDVFVEDEVLVRGFTAAELKLLCKTHRVSTDDIDAFLKSFALPARLTWAPQPPHKPRDVEPWRFERRFSVMLRPLIACKDGEETYYVAGLGTLRDSLTYVLDSTVNGRFDKDVFESREMRSYVGAKVDEAGRDFTRDVASMLRELGWNTEEEVKMSQLGAGKSPNLGDVDVLAWRQSGDVLAIECKRLKSVRTVSEIAQSCARFAGREGDHLHKHLKRMEWIRSNPDRVAKHLGLPSTSLRVEHPLVTNVTVPFSYVKDLPLPSDRIVSVENLKEFVAGAFR